MRVCVVPYAHPLNRIITNFPIMRNLLLLAMGLFACSAANAQIIKVSPQPSSCQLYQRVDIDVELQGEWENPYRQEEARLDMVVTAPDGRNSVVPAFYVEGESGKTSHWAVRYTPQTKGQLTYFLRYSQPSMESISPSFKLDVKDGSGHGFLHVADDWTLRFDDGTPFRGVGENICWESRANDDSKFFKNLHEEHERFSYPAMLPKFAEHGGNFVRFWMCSWNFPIDRKDDFNNSRYEACDGPINPSAVKHLDETVELCEKLGIKIMLCMGAGDARTNNDFFVSEEAKAAHRNRLRYIVARWGYSEAIAMWEFFNEIDNIQFRDNSNPIPAKNIVDWHAHMARYIKSIDAFKHIVTTSISHRDLDGLNSVADMDINQKHIYKNTSVIPKTIENYRKKFGKPYIIGEFGYEWDWSKNFDDFADGMDMDFRRGLWYGLFSPTPVTPMSWWWEYFDNRNMLRFFRAPALVNKEMLENGKGSFIPCEISADKGQAFAVTCGKKTYVYLFNDSKRTMKKVSVKANGSLRELDIEKAVWGKGKNCAGTISTSVKPNTEKVFVIE